MKKCSRKVVFLGLLILGALMVTATSFAEKPPCTEDRVKSPEVCDGKPYHAMESKGIGSSSVKLLNGTYWIPGGNAFQCRGCHVVMVTQGDPGGDYPSYIGRWGTSHVNYPISGLAIHIIGPDAYGTQNSTTMPGYRFVLVGQGKYSYGQE